ncbi:MAG: hypothetical protein LBQ57_01310 [Spirochaetales bacterium]|jgi:hypothetical protein|nr:hypothetical protein [Spirochaetales bacterium]
MKRKHGVFLGFAVLLIAAMMSGCDTGGDDGGGDPGTLAFSVSGSFTKSSEAGGGEVKFDL